MDIAEPLNDIELEQLYDKYIEYCNVNKLRRSMGAFFLWIEEQND